MFGAGSWETCSEHFAALEDFFSWKWAIEFPSGSGICFRSVLRYFLKSECGVGRDCTQGKPLGRRELGGWEITGLKLLGMSTYPQRGERTIKSLPCQESEISSVPRLCPGGLVQRAALVAAQMKV